MNRYCFILLFAVFATAATCRGQLATSQDVIYVPYLVEAPSIDGHLTEWKDYAFSDGVWDVYRVRHEPWYEEGRRNRLTDQAPEEPHPEDDLRSRYYIAWDDEYVYMGAEVVDNVNDVTSPTPAPRAWYSKDSICWFIEAPRDAAPEYFGEGDHSFCFVADASMPDYGAWWRHGTPEEDYVEEPLPDGAVDYALTFDPWGTGEADYVLEARVRMADTFGASDPRWTAPRVGDEYGLEIVHCDPDGGDYGGHLMVYGTGDNDATWGRMILSVPQDLIERLPE